MRSLLLRHKETSYTHARLFVPRDSQEGNSHLRRSYPPRVRPRGSSEEGEVTGSSESNTRWTWDDSPISFSFVGRDCLRDDYPSVGRVVLPTEGGIIDGRYNQEVKGRRTRRLSTDRSPVVSGRFGRSQVCSLLKIRRTSKWETSKSVSQIKTRFLQHRHLDYFGGGSLVLGITRSTPNVDGTSRRGPSSDPPSAQTQRHRRNPSLGDSFTPTTPVQAPSTPDHSTHDGSGSHYPANESQKCLTFPPPERTYVGTVATS